MEHKQTKLSAIIAAHHHLALTEQCVRLLREALAEISHEIIVVDDGSADGTYERIRTKGDIQLIRNVKQLGVAAAWNQGKKAAEGDVLLFLHNDILLTKQALRTMMEALFSKSDIGAVGPLTNACYYGIQQGIQVQGNVRDIASVRRMVHQVEQMGFRPEPLFFLEDFCLLMRREAADAVGEFDEQFFPVGFEDADYALRLRRAGYSLLRVGTYVHNCGGSYLDDGASWSDTWERNQALFHKKWGIIPGYSLMVRLDILKHIDMGKENLSVLDVGCACGTNLMWLKSYHPEARLCGIELNEKSASIAQWFGQVEALDVETLEREEWRNSFDYIILADIVEHLKDPWSLLKRMKGFLKQGGRLIISVPNVCHISNLRNMLHGNWEYENSGILDRTHLRFFTKKSFAKCLEEAGLSIISTEPNHILADHQRRLLQELSSLDDTDITQEELSAIQWIFVAEKMISAQSPTGERSRCARPN